MLKVRKIFTLFTGLILGFGMLVASDTSVCADAFNAPKLGIAEDAPTNPAIKKGDKIFVVIKDTKNKTVAVYTPNGDKTGATVAMGSTYTNLAVKTVKNKKLVQINKQQWLNINDVVKN